MTPAEAAPPVFVHATAVVIGEAGVLVRGASGAGKTSLALRLVDTARRAGRFAALVGDDRVGLVPRHGRLVARPHPAIAGLAERRGLGLVLTPHEPACVLDLVVDILPQDAAPPADRMPEAEALRTEIAGITLARVGVPPLGTVFDPCGLVLAHPALKSLG